MDYPSGMTVDSSDTPSLKEDNWAFCLFISTSYWHNKISPSFFWMYDITDDANMYKVEVAYNHSSDLTFAVGALFLDGGKAGESSNVFDHKDYVYLIVVYRW